MTTIGFIGSGNIGGTVARLAVAAGHEVVLSNSRGPHTLAELVAELGPRARAATPEEAAEAGELVVVTIPLKAYPAVPAGPLRGKVVLDTGNYYPQRDGHVAELDDESTTTSELLQVQLPGSRVVKVFNNINFAHLATLGRPAGHPERSPLLVAGDDADAKARVGAFLDSLGYDTLDAGPLAEGWRFQRDTPAYGLPYMDPAFAGGSPDGGLGPGVPTTAAALREALAAAVRYRDA
ncbi:NADPH-dependent F420 reductase [Kineococcus sp. NUM-3379]